VFISCNVLNIWLFVSMFVSFMCKLFLLILYICYLSNVYKCLPFKCSYNDHFICYGSICMSLFNMWLEYPEFLLLFLIPCICSLYLLWNVPPIRITNKQMDRLRVPQHQQYLLKHIFKTWNSDIHNINKIPNNQILYVCG
jgi:hypothetical protein